MTARDGTTGYQEFAALLGEGAEFEGKLLFEGRVRIDGKFRGEIASDDVLVVGGSAEVQASIQVGTLIVLGGVIRGEVRAAKTVELHAPAKVYGSITTPQLMIDRGVTFEGQSRIPSDEGDPAKEELGAQTESAPNSEPDPAGSVHSRAGQPKE